MSLLGVELSCQLAEVMLVVSAVLHCGNTLATTSTFTAER